MTNFIFAPRRARPGRAWRRQLIRAALLLVVLIGMAEPGFAASSCRNNGNLRVTVSTTGVQFGNYDVLSAAATPGTGTVKVAATCDRARLPFTVAYTVALSTGASGSFAARALASGASQLQYNLYTSAALTTIWGNGSGNSQVLADTLTGTCTRAGGRNCSGSQPDTVYANIPALQNVPAGNYTDSLVVTVNF